MSRIYSGDENKLILGPYALLSVEKVLTSVFPGCMNIFFCLNGQIGRCLSVNHDVTDVLCVRGLANVPPVLWLTQKVVQRGPSPSSHSSSPSSFPFSPFVPTLRYVWSIPISDPVFLLCKLCSLIYLLARSGRRGSF